MTSSVRHRLLQFRRTALLYFLPLMSLNFLAGAAIMRGTPGLLPGEHNLAYALAAFLAGTFVYLLLRPGAVDRAGFVLCLTLGVFLTYRQVSVLFGPVSMDTSRPVFLPLYAYFPVAYFCYFVFLPRTWSERACWLQWALFMAVASARIFPEWDHYAGRETSRSLILYLLVANPIFIALASLMVRVQAMLSESEDELRSSQRELDLLGEVAQREARFDRAVRGSRDGLWEWPDTSTTDAWCSDQVGALLGLPPDRLPATFTAFLERVHPEDREAAEAAFNRGRFGGEAFEVEARLRHADGDDRWFAIKGVADTCPDSGVQCLAGSLQSIHERRLAEERLRESNQALYQFARVAAHDMKAPVQRIGQFAGLLERKADEPPDVRARYTQGIQRQVGSVLSLIDGMLRYATADQEHDIRRVPLQTVLEEVIEALQPVIDERSAEVSVDPLPEVQGNAMELRQVFQNLVGNALKFCEQTPRVRVTADSVGGRVRVRVEDNGIGIPEEYLDTIFNPLERLHAASEFEGHGLGLATVRRIVEKLDGSIAVRSVVGEGTCFTVELPAAVD